jgi:hypothetical protein
MVDRRADTSDDIAKNADLKMQLVSGILNSQTSSGRDFLTNIDFVLL